METPMAGKMKSRRSGSTSKSFKRRVRVVGRRTKTMNEGTIERTKERTNERYGASGEAKRNDIGEAKRGKKGDGMARNRFMNALTSADCYPETTIFISLLFS